MESSPDEGAEIAGVRPHLSVSLSPDEPAGQGLHEPAVRAGAGPPRDWRGSVLWLRACLIGL
jgi:hypothetical protein